MTHRRHWAALLLVAALALVILGQVYFFHRRDYLWDGLFFHALSSICFLLAWRLSRPRPEGSKRQRPSWNLGTWVRERWILAAGLSSGLLLSFLATSLSQNRAVNETMNGAVWTWALGLGIALAAALWPTERPEVNLKAWRSHLQGQLADHGPELATVGALTALALILRAVNLGRVPYTLGGDEAWHGLLARQVIDGRLRNPFTMGYMSMPTFFYWPLSWSLRVAGNNMAGLRLPAAVIGAMTVPLLYILARDQWGRRTAVLAALFLATYDYHIHYSRLGANNIWDPFFVLLVLWMVDRGLVSAGPRQAERWFLLAGLVMGLSFYFYTGARLLPWLLTAYLLYIWLQGWSRQGNAEPRSLPSVRRIVALLLLLCLTLTIAAGPMISYAASHPNEWNARVNQVGILQSGWLEREPELTGKSTPHILAEQFLRAAGAFHVFPDRTVWYGSERPLLGFGAGIFAILGMAWALAHWLDRRAYLLLIWFWSVIITGGMLTESPPSSQRLVIAIPAVALLVTLGLEQVVQLARRLLPSNSPPPVPPWLTRVAQAVRARLARTNAEDKTPQSTTARPSLEAIVLGLLILLLAISSVRYYFVEFTPQRRYGSQNGETATMIGHYLSDLEGDISAYFFGAPRIYWKFGTMTFIAPDVPGQDVVDPLQQPPSLQLETERTLFIFLPERRNELAYVEQAFPGGIRDDVHDPGGLLCFVVYAVSARAP